MLHFKICFDNNPLLLAMEFSIDLTIFTAEVCRSRSTGVGVFQTGSGAKPGVDIFDQGPEQEQV